MTSRWTGPALAVLAILTLAPAAGAVVRLPLQFVNEIQVGNLAEPNSMAFLPDGRVLLTEQRTGKVRMVVGGHIAVTDPVLTVPSLNNAGYERGLQGIAVDPRWPAFPYVYLYYNRTGSRNRLVRYTATGDLTNPAGESLLLSGPLLLLDDIPDNDPNHNAGCLRFGPDERLYVSLGDDEQWCTADDIGALSGRILRLDVSRLPAGSGGPVPKGLLDPGDNPFATPDSVGRLTYAYGMRNPWRFHVDPKTGRIYGADVGENIIEELNEILAGDYMGWPYREGNQIVQRANCPEPGGPGSTPYKAPILLLQRNPDLTAINEGGVYRRVAGGSFNWPFEYDGHLFFGEYYSGVLRRLQRNAQGTWQPAPPAQGQPNSTDWATGFISAVDFMVGPDGSLWCLRQFDDNLDGETGTLQRIRYIGTPVDTPAPASVITELLTSRPNPFASTVELSFKLTSAGPIRLRIFDLSGRLVRGIVDETYPAGEHHVTWDGFDTNRSATRPGVYLARLETPAGALTTRLLRLE